jgi:hypothetical protein
MFHSITDVTEKLPDFTAVSLLATFRVPAATVFQPLVLQGSPHELWDRDEQTECRAGWFSEYNVLCFKYCRLSWLSCEDSVIFVSLLFFLPGGPSFRVFFVSKSFQIQFIFRRGNGAEKEIGTTCRLTI